MPGAGGSGGRTRRFLRTLTDGDAKKATDTARQITPLIHRLPPYVVEPLVREPISEQAVFEAAKDFPGQESGEPVHITAAEESGHTKALTALPFKPAIMIEKVLFFLFFNRLAVPASAGIRAA